MKRLGVTQEEGETMEMTLLRYLNLFKGPMSDLVIKGAGGLDGPAMLGRLPHNASLLLEDSFMSC
jgi:hypothetical protein